MRGCQADSTAPTDGPPQAFSGADTAGLRTLLARFLSAPLSPVKAFPCPGEHLRRPISHQR